jgi:hypothetical protein
MSKPEEVKKGYWFFDTVFKKPIQAKYDAQQDIVTGRRYAALPLTHETLTRVGFKLKYQPEANFYELKGFLLYHVKHLNGYYLKEYGKFRTRFEYMHHLQKKFREEIETYYYR